MREHEVVFKVKKFIIASFFSLLFIGNILAQGDKPAKTENTPIEFTFTDFKGATRKFSEFRGKYVLLDFWATWCKPCLADIPHLKELYDKNKVRVQLDRDLGDDAQRALAAHHQARQVVAGR